MSTTSYGEHAERVAAALAVLVRGPALPVDPRLQPLVVNCREIAIAALRDRFWNQFLVQVKEADPALSKPSRFDALQGNPVVALAYVVERFPRMPPTERQGPIDALKDVSDAVGQAWITAARELLSANHVLNTAEIKPWRTEATAHAALASDTAQVVEAIAVLDQRLHAAGALARHHVREADLPASVTTARLVASSVDRLAHWIADHTTADLATASPNRPVEFSRCVHLVQTPSDLAAGQHALATFLTPMADHDLRPPYRITAATALAVAHNQAILLAQLRDRIATSPGPNSELSRVDRLQNLLDRALHASRGLHDSAGPHVHILIRGQQQEISVGIRKGHIQDLGDQQVSQLLGATEVALGTWAAALHREISSPTTDLRVARRGLLSEHGYIDEPFYGRLSNIGSAAQALKALAKHKAVRFPRAQVPSSGARAGLRGTLSQTPPLEATEWPIPEGRATKSRPPVQRTFQQPHGHRR